MNEIVLAEGQGFKTIISRDEAVFQAQASRFGDLLIWGALITVAVAIYFA
jgi:hypothetical protein